MPKRHDMPHDTPHGMSCGTLYVTENCCHVVGNHFAALDFKPDSIYNKLN